MGPSHSPGQHPDVAGNDRGRIDAYFCSLWQRGPLGKAQFGDIPWLHRQFDVVQETPYEFKTVGDLEAPESCRPNEGAPGNPLFLLNHWVDTSPYFLPRNARRVNAYEALLRRARRCMSERKRFPNLVTVDFFDEGDVVRVAKTLMNEGRRAGSAQRRGQEASSSVQGR